MELYIKLVMAWIALNFVKHTMLILHSKYPKDPKFEIWDVVDAVICLWLISWGFRVLDLEAMK